MKLSIIVPVLNEAQSIEACLQSLQTYRQKGHELIVVDGGSHDHTVVRARPFCDVILSSPAGRARQMNGGAAQAGGEALLFLHADTCLPDNFDTAIQAALAGRIGWGRFDVKLSGRHSVFRLIEFMMNQRSRLSGIATGDQALFVSRVLFEKVGGYADIPLMEDIALSKALKHHCPPVCLRQRVTTSSRRWEQYGIWRTVFLMWRLRLAYFAGVSPAKLAKVYRSG